MNTSKTWLLGGALLVLGLAGGWLVARWQAPQAHSAATSGAVAPDSGAASAPERKVLYWYDPMVPTQKFDKPGKSPFMDMQLVPKYADESAEASAGVAVSPQAVQSLGVRVVRAEMRAMRAHLEVPGTVALNERDVALVQARAAGYVERVYARAPGDVVAAGAPLADLLHPEWLAAQREFLAVRGTADATLTGAARQRLQLLGMPAELVEQVERGGEPQALTTVRAPIGGLIAELGVRAGMTVSPGMTLARINGLGTVWVDTAVPEALAATVRTGQSASVRLPALPGDTLRGRVTAVLPEANRDTRTLRVRIELPNPGQRLRPGLFAQVSLAGAAPANAVVVPAEAVIRTGRRVLLYVLDAPGRYRPVEVELGDEADGWIVVRRGIAAGQQVVASGQFLIDSEASLQGLRPESAASAPMSKVPSAAASEHGAHDRTRTAPGAKP